MSENATSSAIILTGDRTTGPLHLGHYAGSLRNRDRGSRAPHAHRSRAPARRRSGRVEGNVVFTYLDAFDEDQDAVADLKVRYRRGGLGDMAVKRRLVGVPTALVGPIRERRAELARDPDYVMDILRTGTRKAREVTGNTKPELHAALGLFLLGPVEVFPLILTRHARA
jgi:tryptophanyl-tRNA synthetase